MKKSELIFSAILVPVDLAMFLLAGTLAYFVRTSSVIADWRPVMFSVSLPFGEFFMFLSIAGIFTLAVCALTGLYQIRPSKKLFEVFYQVAIAVSASVLAVIVVLFLTGKEFESRFLVLATWILSIFFIFIGRFLIKKIQRFLVGKYNIGTHNVLIIGGDGMSANIVKEINNNPDLGYRIIRHFPKLDINKIKKALENPAVDSVMLASPNYKKEGILDIIDFCEEHHIGFKFVPNLFQTLTTNIEIDTFGGVPLIEIKKTPLDGWGKILKRGIDIIGSGIGILLLWPFYLVIGAIIKIDSPGPVMIKLKRISQGKKFNLYKFRSMVKNAEKIKPKLLEKNERTDGPLFKIKNDPRITKAGKFLRRFRIDEFPQLINVFKGEMSLIGPRPHQLDEIAQYKKHHKKVLLIKSGMTGLAQVSGSSDLSFEEEVKLDSYYIENWSLKKDIYILLKTVLVLFIDRSAC